MELKLPTPIRTIQDGRYAKQDGWWLDDISLCSSGNIAVSGHCRYQSYVCIYNSNDNDSSDKPTLIYQKEFTHERPWKPRCISFIKPNSTEIVTCQHYEVQVINYNRDVLLRSRKVNGLALCLSVSESQIFIGLLMSDVVNIYDNDLNRIKSIRLKGIINDHPLDQEALVAPCLGIAAAANRLYVRTGSDWRKYSRAIVCSQDSGNILTEYTTGSHCRHAYSMAVNVKLGLTAVLWYHGRTGQTHIFIYLLSENKSFLTVNVEDGVTRVTISDQGRIVTGNPDTGDVKIYNMASLFSYSHLKESLISRLDRDDCKKLADFFGIGTEELNTILNSDKPSAVLLPTFEEKGILHACNVDRLEKALLGLTVSPPLSEVVNVYQRLRSENNMRQTSAESLPGSSSESHSNFRKSQGIDVHNKSDPIVADAVTVQLAKTINEETFSSGVEKGQLTETWKRKADGLITEEATPTKMTKLAGDKTPSSDIVQSQLSDMENV